jgi:hypothetical protein
MQYNLSYGFFARALLTVVGLGKGSSYVILSHDTVRVRMGWAFSAEIPRSAILGAHVRIERVLSRGVHGWQRRWIVNGSTNGLVSITFDPAVTARVWPFRVTMKRLTVSVEQPNELVAALQVG